MVKGLQRASQQRKKKMGASKHSKKASRGQNEARSSQCTITMKKWGKKERNGRKRIALKRPEILPAKSQGIRGGSLRRASLLK